MSPGANSSAPLWEPDLRCPGGWPFGRKSEMLFRCLVLESFIGFELWPLVHPCNLGACHTDQWNAWKLGRSWRSGRGGRTSMHHVLHPNSSLKRNLKFTGSVPEVGTAVAKTSWTTRNWGVCLHSCKNSIRGLISAERRQWWKGRHGWLFTEQRAKFCSTTSVIPFAAIQNSAGECRWSSHPKRLKFAMLFSTKTWRCSQSLDLNLSGKRTSRPTLPVKLKS